MNARITTPVRAFTLELALALLLALTLALTPTPSAALAPALLVMIKQVAQQAASSMFKDALLSGLSGMGCKGIALSNALQAFELRGGVGVGMGVGLGLGLPKMPAGMTPGLQPEMTARMKELLPGANQLPPGMALGPDQMAAIAQLQQAMSEPPPAAQTLAIIDELFELGFLPPAIRGELKECMVLVPAAVPALGMGMGMLKPVLPQLRQARAELRALPPAEQDEVAAALVEQLRSLPAAERAAALEPLEAGFFPPRVVQKVKAALTGR
jgi:hypothetical protein